MFFEDDTADQIKQCLECKYPKCINCLGRRTHPPRRAERAKKPPSFDTVTAKKMYGAGQNDIEISLALNVSRQKIGRWRRQLGLGPVMRSGIGKITAEKS